MPDNLYLELYHGRCDPKAAMDDWGADGPVFGPYHYVQVTYGSHIKMGTFAGQVHDLLVEDNDLVYYDGMWYGDYLVLASPLPDDVDARRTDYDREKARTT